MMLCGRRNSKVADPIEGQISEEAGAAANVLPAAEERIVNYLPSSRAGRCPRVAELATDPGDPVSV